ncbi:MAG: quinoprotein glucose dehydrogenase [Bacteroidetes bacterium]|nr:MAG: quinoprotein glucose dehydrogenase [Bacteroidota bacterium]
MRHVSPLLIGLFSLLLLWPAAPIRAQEPAFAMRPVGPNLFLDKPWALLYGPDDYLWVTERAQGKVVRVHPETAQRDELIQIADHASTASQDGLLGMALHPDFQEDSPFVYLSYTHLVQGERVQKIVRYSYSLTGDDGSLFGPETILDGLPASNDHNSGRLLFGPDQKLYYTIGDQGGNQNANYCNPILSQVLPSQAEVNQQDWTHYPGKILRLNPDGSIPADNPAFGGVQSHIFSIGHRNPQGLVFGPNGRLYSDEHGPNTDDEVNLIEGGKNYGWPRVVGFQDDQAYDYCDWSSAPDCENLSYSNGSCPPNATFLPESSFSDSTYMEPLFSMFAVPDTYDYNNPLCQNSWICRPNVAPASIAYYGSDSLPGWKNSLLIASLKRGRIYRLQLDSSGTAVVGDTLHHFYTPNRYRDIAIAPDGKTFYILTGETGRTSDLSGFNIVNANSLQNPGNILEFSLQEASTSVAAPVPHPPFRLGPNPAHDRLSLHLQQPAPVRLMDQAGRVVRDYSTLGAGTHALPVHGLPAGFYILSIQSPRRVWYEPLSIY